MFGNARHMVTYLVNGLSSSAKSGFLTVFKYKFYISIVKKNKAGNGIGNLP